MADFEFVGGAYEAPSIYQDAQELINWRCEIDPNDAAKIVGQPPKRGIIALYPTPGYTTKSQIVGGEVRGLHAISGGQELLAVIGNAIYTYDTLMNPTFIALINTTSGHVGIDDNGVQVMIVDGHNRYSYTIATNAFALIPTSDGAFVGGGVVCAVDNYLVYNLPNSQQFAATNGLSTVTPALSFASKYGSPDNLVSIEVNNRIVYLLGEVSTECWIDVGSFPFPFQLIAGSSSQHGCAAQYSVARLGDSFAFLSKDSKGGGIICNMTGYAPTRISTHAVEQSILGKKIDDAVAWSYQLEGHECYVITFPAIDLTWQYDLSTGLWNKFMSSDSNGVYHRHRGNCAAYFAGMVLVGDYQNGSIYALDNSVYTESGNPIKRLRRCPHITSDLQRIFFEELQIQFEPGVGIQSGQGQNPQCMLRWSNDGGSTWSNEYWRSIGNVGQYKNRAMWRRLGNARDRVFEVSITDPIKAVIISANLKASVGDN